uniref:Uncharacterized protein n=1 Tax=Ochrobactrum phage ORM_20 TaxID=2985243 RepID=A0A9N6ZGH9_9VIRU|nr:hypothetical protein ORM20_00165 [Ochrobactrum phage ORM_20]
MFVESGFDCSPRTYYAMAGIASLKPVPGTESGEPKLGVYYLDIDCGRMGSLTGKFSATDRDVADLIGKEYYASEALGKYSEISGKFEPKHFGLVTDDPFAVDVFNKYDFASGWNPYDILQESDDE